MFVPRHTCSPSELTGEQTRGHFFTYKQGQKAPPPRTVYTVRTSTAFVRQLDLERSDSWLRLGLISDSDAFACYSDTFSA